MCAYDALTWRAASDSSHCTTAAGSLVTSSSGGVKGDTATLKRPQFTSPRQDKERCVKLLDQLVSVCVLTKGINKQSSSRFCSSASPAAIRRCIEHCPRVPPFCRWAVYRGGQCCSNATDTPSNNNNNKQQYNTVCTIVEVAVVVGGK
jgi:hypothetical protein